MTKGIDLYTKIVLSVIAICLAYIVTKDINIVPEARAQSKGAAIDVNIVSVGTDRIPFGYISYPASLPVKMCDK